MMVFAKSTWGLCALVLVTVYIQVRPVLSNGSDVEEGVNQDPFECKEGWAYYHYRVFATEEYPEFLGHEGTLKMLKTLRNCYLGKDPKEVGTKLERVEALLDQANISEDKCLDWDELERYNGLIKYFSMYNKNVVPYLEHFRLRQLRVCQPVLLAKLKKTLLEQVIPFDRDRVQELKIDVIDAQPDINKKGLASSLILMPYRNVVDGLAKYIVRHGEEMRLPEVTALKRARHASFWDKVMYPMFGTCQRVYQSLQPIMSVYTKLVVNKDFVSNLDPFAIHWITADQVCHSLLSKNRQLSDEVYDRIKKGIKQ